MDKLEVLVSKYNQLVSDWNERFGDKYCSAMPVDSDEFKESYTSRIKAIFTDGMSERRKVSMTKTLVGDFKNIDHIGIEKDGSVSRGELAYLIVEKSNQILKDT